MEPRNENNIGNSKKDPISNNSNKFKENFTTTNTTILTTGAETPGITNRKVKLKSNNNGSGDSSPRSTEGNHQGSNPDDWMADLTPREVQMIMDSGICKMVLEVAVIKTQIFYVCYIGFFRRCKDQLAQYLLCSFPTY